MPLDVGYVMDNIDHPYRGEKRVVFLTILAMARMVIWETQKMRLYNGTNFSHHGLKMGGRLVITILTFNLTRLIH